MGPWIAPTDPSRAQLARVHGGLVCAVLTQSLPSLAGPPPMGEGPRHPATRDVGTAARSWPASRSPDHYVVLVLTDLEPRCAWLGSLGRNPWFLSRSMGLWPMSFRTCPASHS